MYLPRSAQVRERLDGQQGTLYHALRVTPFLQVSGLL